MGKKIVEAILWSELKKTFSNKTKDIDLIKNLNSCITDKDYVYYSEVPFGEQIIKNGKLLKDEFELKINPKIKINQETFISDIGYSSDPLGLVIDNYLEVVGYNRKDQILKIDRNNKFTLNQKYPVLYNRIYSEQLFGLFGTLNYFSNSKTEIEEEWDVFSGNVTFEIDFPYNNLTEKLHIIQSTDTNELTLRDLFFKNYITEIERRIELFKLLDEIPTAKVIIFPLSVVKNLFDKSIFKELFLIAWQQSFDLRNSIFEIDTFYNLISPRNSKNSNSKFQAILLHYIYKVIHNKANILVPIDETHFLFEIWKKLLDVNSISIDKTEIDEKLKYKKTIPFIYVYESLKNNDFGLISMKALPIKSNIIVNDFGNEVDALKKNQTFIWSKIENFSKESNSEVSLINAYGNPRGIIVEDREKLREFLAKKMNLMPSNFNLVNDEFCNLLLLKFPN